MTTGAAAPSSLAEDIGADIEFAHDSPLERSSFARP
jgi:hypothetical protein